MTRAFMVLLAVAACTSSLRAQQTTARHALFVGSAERDEAFVHLQRSLGALPNLQLQRIGADASLRNSLRAWANQVRQAPAEWALLYVDAQRVARGADGDLAAKLGGGPAVTLPLADALNRMVRAAGPAPSLLVIHCPAAQVRETDLQAIVDSVQPAGPLAVWLLACEPARRAFDRWLGGGQIGISDEFTPLRLGNLLAALRRNFPGEVLAAGRGDVGDVELCQHPPRTLEAMLAAMGEEIGDGWPAPSLMVVPDAVIEGDPAPLLERVAAVHLRAALAASQHRVLAQENLRQLQIHSGSSAVAIAKQVAHLDPHPVVVRLQLIPDGGGAEMRVRCAVAGGTAERRVLEGLAVLTPAQWGLQGRSVITKEGWDAVRLPGTPRSLPALGTIDFARPANFQRVLASTRDLERRARQEDHPLVDPEFPYRVELRVGGKPAPSYFSPDRKRQYSRVERGDRYTIHVKNTSSKPIFLRLLVDGLNTLPDRPLVEYTLSGDALFETVAKDQDAELVPAPYALLHNARSWFCEPGEYEVRGFFTHIDTPRSESFSTVVSGKRAEFVVTDASLSEASQRGYLKDVGIITAAVFSAVDDPVLRKGIGARYGTRMGNTAAENVQLYNQNLVPGDLLAVIHLHYGYGSDTR